MPYCQCPFAFWPVSSCPDWRNERCQIFGMCERIILSSALFQQRYRSRRLRGWSVAIVSLINKLISSLKPAASLQGQGSSHILTTLLPFSTSWSLLFDERPSSATNLKQALLYRYCSWPGKLKRPRIQMFPLFKLWHFSFSSSWHCFPHHASCSCSRKLFLSSLTTSQYSVLEQPTSISWHWLPGKISCKKAV